MIYSSFFLLLILLIKRSLSLLVDFSHGPQHEFINRFIVLALLHVLAFHSLPLLCRGIGLPIYDLLDDFMSVEVAFLIKGHKAALLPLAIVYLDHLGPSVAFVQSMSVAHDEEEMPRARHRYIQAPDIS